MWDNGRHTDSDWFWSLAAGGVFDAAAAAVWLALVVAGCLLVYFDCACLSRTVVNAFSHERRTKESRPHCFGFQYFEIFLHLMRHISDIPIGNCSSEDKRAWKKERASTWHSRLS